MFIQIIQEILAKSSRGLAIQYVLCCLMCEVKEKERHGTTDTWRAKENIKGQHCLTVVSNARRVHCLWAHLCDQIAWNFRFKQFWLKQVLLFLFHSWSIFTYRMLWEGLVKCQICRFFHPPTPCLLLFCKPCLSPWLIPANAGCSALIHYRDTLMSVLSKSPWLAQKSESFPHMISLWSTHLNLHKQAARLILEPLCMLSKLMSQWRVEHSPIHKCENWGSIAKIHFYLKASEGQHQNLR